METPVERLLLRAYLRSADRVPFTPTHDRVIKAALTHGVAGATVFRGVLGYGSRGWVKASAGSVVEHVPVIVEIVDSAEKIAGLIAGPLDEIMSGGMLTVEPASACVLREGSGSQPRDAGLIGSLRPTSNLPHIELKGHMTNRQTGVLLRIFIGENDRADGKFLYEAIVQKARELGLAGATVLRGMEGFGANSIVHRTALLEMSRDLPIVIEMVDSEEKLNLLLPYLETVVTEGMITMENVLILLYRHGGASAER